MKLFAKKSLGQHFLNSPSVLAKIIETAAIKEGDKVLEIGPGTGVLTEALLKAGASVVAVEKDSRSIAMLEVRFTPEISSGRLKIISGDVLELNPDSQLPTPFFVVANIPYYITGAILEKFLEHGPRPDKMVLLVQKEVAERIVARDGKESVLSISVKAFGAPHLVAKVPPGAFTPPPTVDSAILSITAISDATFREKNIDIKKFFILLKAGFAHKRKYLARNLEDVVAKEKIEKVWVELALDPKVRAEDLKLSDWIAIASRL